MYHIGVSRLEITRIQKIIAELDAQVPALDADRRIHPRIDFSHPMWLNLPADPGSPWVRVYSRNLSTGGLAFLTRKLVYNGQYLIIAHELNEKCPQLVLCKTCFCRTVELDIMEVGLAFQAVEADPTNVRRVPPDWTKLVLQGDWLARRATPTPAV